MNNCSDGLGNVDGQLSQQLEKRKIPGGIPVSAKVSSVAFQDAAKVTVVNAF